jgi:uncharacterized protein YaaR (DUF327 family)
MDIRVSEILGAHLNPASQKAADKPPHEDFSFTLNRLTEDGLVKRLSGLIDNIVIQGDKLSKHMDINDLKDYKSMIGEFLNEVVTNSHEFSRENFLDRRGRHRVFGIVRQVNKAVDDLGQELLKSQKNNLAVLEKTGLIRGLLLDIMI